MSALHLAAIITAAAAAAGLVGFGFDACMTETGPVIQGYIGTLIPVTLALIVGACGYILGSVK